MNIEKEKLIDALHDVFVKGYCTGVMDLYTGRIEPEYAPSKIIDETFQHVYHQVIEILDTGDEFTTNTYQKSPEPDQLLN